MDIKKKRATGIWEIWIFSTLPTLNNSKHHPTSYPYYFSVSLVIVTIAVSCMQGNIRKKLKKLCCWNQTNLVYLSFCCMSYVTAKSKWNATKKVVAAQYSSSLRRVKCCSHSRVTFFYVYSFWVRTLPIPSTHATCHPLWWNVTLLNETDWMNLGIKHAPVFTF